jgi:hypothetical protein
MIADHESADHHHHHGSGAEHQADDIERFPIGRSNRACFIGSRCRTFNPARTPFRGFPPSERTIAEISRWGCDGEISVMHMLLLVMTTTIALGIFAVYKVTP